MTISRRLQTALITVVLSVLIAPAAGCGLFSRSKEKPPEVSQPATPPLPAATPAPPPPPRRPTGVRIADEEKLKTLIQGKTTKEEVRGLFGIPQEIVLAPGIETFIYFREASSGWISRTTERVETLTVRFDAKGALKDFEYRYSGR
jgi:hypothetical protein